LKLKNVEYIDKNSNIEYILHFYHKNDIYILLDTDEYVISGNLSLAQYRFKELYEKSDSSLSKFLIAKLKIYTKIKGPGYPVIRHYINRKLANNSDYFEEEELNILLLVQKMVRWSDDSNGSNEQLEKGASATQGCRCYTVQLTDNKVIRLIDTPGIGSSYRPGTTSTSLRKFLDDLKEKSGVEIKVNKETSFYLDNELFKILAQIQKGVSFTAEEEEDFKKIKDILSLNNSRKMIKFLLNILATMQVTIDDTINKIIIAQKMLQENNKTIKEILETGEEILEFPK
ncbi:8517_t:CDS:2, partial [Racocetra persica]